jgi:arylsulfatase A-like enzyme
MDPKEHRRVDRRTFLKGGIAGAGALAGAGIAIRAFADTGGGSSSPPTTQPSTPPQAATRVPPSGSGHRQPNILVIMVDQLRFPQWFSANPGSMALPPNLARLRSEGVSFARHYTASNDCTPARSTLLTGLYTHQTGCMITGGSTLDPGFPTWGTMLREHGYHTRWLGKWHLTHRDGHWTPTTGERDLERYGFAGGVYPSPDGGPGQGWRVDPYIASKFAQYYAQEDESQPWCTTVSFVNPHDIAWWYRWTNRVPPERHARSVIHRLPPNYETPEELIERAKPLLQRSFQETTAASFGGVPFTGPKAKRRFLEFVDLYMKIQLEVDRQIGDVLRTLESRPEVAANTVVVFTSDHGEYGASHGMRGKGASAYEECIRVPLIVKDPRGVLTSATEQERTQLTSSVDIAPLLLTIGSGSDEWRTEAHYSHLAKRADLAAILANPSAPGRDLVIHATDEIVTEFAIEPYAAYAPLHIVAIRTPKAKFATYSHWSANGFQPLTKGAEVELYDYSSQRGRLEVENTAGHNPIEPSLRAVYASAFSDELREPLPPRLTEAHARGFADYFSTARHSAKAAAARRKVRTERELESGGTPGPELGPPRAGAHPRRHRARRL